MNYSAFDQTAYFLLKTLMRILSALPAEKALGFGRWLGRIAYYVSGRRGVAYADLKAALGGELGEKARWNMIRRHYQNLGQMFVEILLFPKIDLKAVERYIQIHHKERFFEAIEKDKGVILLTGHFGNWEFLQIVSGILGKPIHALANRQKHDRLNELLNRLRESHGSVAVAKGMGMRDLLRNLRRKELVGMVGDQTAGKHEGVILPFFGRKTTIPTGAFEISVRTGAPILPCFMIRRDGPSHDIYVEETIPDFPDPPELKMEKQIRSYLSQLEELIRKYPDQWLWETKRWKYTWTKRILILSDAKPGHEKQSLAVAAQFKTISDQYGRPGMEYPAQKINIEFKSKWHQKIFPFFTFFFIPFAQGRLGWLKAFFTPETLKEIVEASTDFVISAGSALVPLNLCIARDSRAKSIVLMKPSFPFNWFAYDLAIIPTHDTGIIPKNALRTLLTPNVIDELELGRSQFKFSRSLVKPEAVKFSVFIGGPTRRFKIELSQVEKLFSVMERIAKKEGDYLVTTSRRTPPEVTRMIESKTSRQSSCQLFVDVTKDPRPEVASGMMALAEIILVSEDSISMISEAISAGKKVIVLNLGSEGLPAKHQRFREILERESAVTLASPGNLEEKIKDVLSREPVRLAEREKSVLRSKLQEIL